MTHHFAASPATLTFRLKSGKQTWIGESVYLEWLGPQSNGPPMVLVVRGRGDERSWPVDELDPRAPDHWQGRVWNEDGRDLVPLSVRPTRPRDSANSVTMSGFPVPLPVEVIAHLHSSDDIADPDLIALTDVRGDVKTILLRSAVGTYWRSRSKWHEVDRLEAEFGSELVEHQVLPAGLKLYDERARPHRHLHVGELSPSSTLRSPSGSAGRSA